MWFMNFIQILQFIGDFVNETLNKSILIHQLINIIKTRINSYSETIKLIDTLHK